MLAVIAVLSIQLAKPSRAEDSPPPPLEIPENAIENYLEDDMKIAPDGTYIPYPEDVEKFRDSPLYKFFERLSPEKDGSRSPPSGGGCKVDKKFLESV